MHFSRSTLLALLSTSAVLATPLVDVPSTGGVQLTDELNKALDNFKIVEGILPVADGITGGVGIPKVETPRFPTSITTTPTQTSTFSNTASTNTAQPTFTSPFPSRGRFNSTGLNNSTLNPFNNTRAPFDDKQAPFNTTRDTFNSTRIPLVNSTGAQPANDTKPSSFVTSISSINLTPSQRAAPAAVDPPIGGNAPVKRSAEPATAPAPVKATTPNVPTVPSLPSSGGSCNNTQTNTCSSGIPFCCSPDGKNGNTCVHATVQCQQTVICCNNANGFQICMGNIDFNMPITINLNMAKAKREIGEIEAIYGPLVY